MYCGFEIISSPESYEVTEQSVYGELFVKNNDFFFPFDQWGDLVVSVISMWTDNAIVLMSNIIGTQEEFYFLDGPHFLLQKS